MVLVQKEVKRITIRPNWSEVQIRPAAASDALYFEAETANSTINLWRTGSPTTVSLETSTDGISWTDYAIWTTITLSSVWDKVYMRNKSETPTGFSLSTSTNYYYFSMTWSVSAYWSINYLLCKNNTDILSNYCLCRLFNNVTQLKLPPSLPATTLWDACYYRMFYGCSNMVWIPKLPAITMKTSCYWQLFYGCSKIKLSSTQTWSYTQPYRIPTTWTWTTASSRNNNMFGSTWWSFAWNPTIDTTYYVHTDNTIVW